MKIEFNPDILSYSSRAVAYGDGCFTTMLYRDGSVKHLPKHLQRLQQSCERLGISDFSMSVLKQSLVEFVAEISAHKEGVIKVLISSGSGGRGYARNARAECQSYISFHPIPLHYSAWKKGITLGLSKIKLAKQPELSGIKHLNRLEQVLVKLNQTCVIDCDVQNNREDSVQINDLVVTDTDGMMVEVSSANLFWREQQQWYTPDLHYCGVEGVVRACIIEQLSNQKHPVIQVRSKPEALLNADELFICNSVMGMIPVRKLIIPREPNAKTMSKHFDILSPYFEELNVTC